MKPSSLELAHIFQKDRPVMDKANSDVIQLFELLMDEVKEATVAMIIHHDKNTEQTRTEAIFELADVILFANSAIYALGGNTETVLRDKVGRNILKYPARGYKNGSSYDEQVQLDKQRWKAQGGDDEFFRE